MKSTPPPETPITPARGPCRSDTVLSYVVRTALSKCLRAPNSALVFRVFRVSVVSYRIDEDAEYFVVTHPALQREAPVNVVVEVNEVMGRVSHLCPAA